MRIYRLRRQLSQLLLPDPHFTWCPSLRAFVRLISQDGYYRCKCDSERFDQVYRPHRSHNLSLILDSALDMSKVPDKLHCPGCHNFLANAFKTPCCDQAICETCMFPLLYVQNHTLMATRSILHKESMPGVRSLTPRPGPLQAQQSRQNHSEGISQNSGEKACRRTPEGRSGRRASCGICTIKGACYPCS